MRQAYNLKMSRVGNVITEVLSSKRLNIKLKRKLFLIYRKQCTINDSDIDKHKEALDKMAGDIEYSFQESRTSTGSALKSFDAFVIGHTVSHQYYQMIHVLKTIRVSLPGMWHESYRLMKFVTDSTVGFDCGTEVKIYR